MKGLEALAKMEYPGRFIIIGRDNGGEDNILIYGITEIRPLSRARRLVEDKEKGVVRTEVTDKEQLEKGNPALLIYPAIASINNTIIASNGAQTALIYNTAEANSNKTNSKEILERAFGTKSHLYDSKNGWINISEYEPDHPNFTPRISGCLQPDNAAVCIIRKGQMNSKEEIYREVTLESGKGKLIATYTGVNTDPLPSFEGEPLDVCLEGRTIDEILKNVYVALLPKDHAKDFRVGVAVVYSNIETSENRISIINRCDLGGG